MLSDKDNFKVGEESEQSGAKVKYMRNNESKDGLAVDTDEISVDKKPTIISSETVIQGNINASNDLEICSQIIGDIKVDGVVKIVNGTITGNIKAGKLYIKESVVEGDIESDSVIDIIDNSKITGNITGSDVVVNCECKGNIMARECLQVLVDAVVTGDIQTKKIKIDEGAIVEGQFKMIQ